MNDALNIDQTIPSSLLPLGEDCLDIFMLSRIEPELPKLLFEGLSNGRSHLQITIQLDRPTLSDDTISNAIESLSHFISINQFVELHIGILQFQMDSDPKPVQIPILHTRLRIELTETVDYFILDLHGDNQLAFHASYLRYIQSISSDSDFGYDWLKNMQHHPDRFSFLHQVHQNLSLSNLWEHAFTPCPKHILQLPNGVHPFAIMQQREREPNLFLNRVSVLHQLNSYKIESLDIHPALHFVPDSVLAHDVSDLIDVLIPFSHNVLIVDPLIELKTIANEAKEKAMILQFDDDTSIKKSLIHFLQHPFIPSKKEEDLFARWLTIKHEQALLEEQLQADCTELHREIIDQQDWSELLFEHIFNKDYDFIQFMDDHLSKATFHFTIDEYRQIQKELSACRDNYHRIGSFTNPLLTLNNHHPIFEKKEEETIAILSLRLREYINRVQLILYNDKQASRKKLNDTIQSDLSQLYELKSEASYLKNLLIVHQQHFGDYVDLNKNFHFYKNKMLGFFSAKHQRLFESHKQIDRQIQRLKNTYTRSQIPDLILPFSPLSFTSHLYITKLNRLLSDIETVIHQLNGENNKNNKSSAAEFNEPTFILESDTTEKVRQCIDAIYQEGILNSFGTVPSGRMTLTSVLHWIDQIHAIIDQLGQLKDRMDWQLRFDSISSHSKALIRFFDKCKVSDWATAFRSWFTFQLLSSKFTQVGLFQEVYYNSLCQRIIYNKQFLDQHAATCRQFLDQQRRSTAIESLLKTKSIDLKLIDRFLANKKTEEIIQWLSQKTFASIFPFVYTTKSDLSESLFETFQTVITTKQDRSDRRKSFFAQQCRIEIHKEDPAENERIHTIPDSPSFQLLNYWIQKTAIPFQTIQAGNTDQWYDALIINESTTDKTRPSDEMGSTDKHFEQIYITLDHGIHGRNSSQLIQQYHDKQKYNHKTSTHINITSHDILKNPRQFIQQLKDMMKA